MKIQKGAKVNLIEMSPMVQGTVTAISGMTLTVKYRETNQRRSWTGRATWTVHTVQVLKSQVQLALAWRDGSAHSQKGLKTLEGMGVNPESVAHVHIKYVKEIHPVDARFFCECCRGTGSITVPQRLAVAAGLDLTPTTKYVSVLKKLDGTDHTDWQEGDWTSVSVDCPKECTLGHCYQMSFKKDYFGVKEVRQIEFTIGYPQWSKGVKFDSRFGRGHGQCQLCAKAIPSGLFSAIEGKDATGQAHGLWVGCDCARKFTGYNTEHEILDGTKEVMCGPNQGHKA